MNTAINTSDIPRRRLYTGGTIPGVGLGTFGSDHVAADEVGRAVAECIAMGYRYIDCAACYGNEPEIGRVLKPNGLLIAPNFVEHKGTFVSRIWSGILRIAGIRFEHQWSAQEYLDFLEKNGWRIVFRKEMKARIALMYAECQKCAE